MTDVPLASGRDASRSKYLNVADGARVEVIFLGEPLDRDVHWVDKRSYYCTGPTACVLCALGEKPSLRFAINVVAAVAAVRNALVLEMSATTFKEVLAHRNQDVARFED